MSALNREGQTVPNTVFHTRQNSEWVDVSTDEIFKGKTVVLFAVPGAFTPVCSIGHLPGYAELADVFKANGVDTVACLAVNDAFVMNEWAAAQGVDNLLLLPDGNADFTKAFDLVDDKTAIGLGLRTHRYSMLVKDGVVEKMFIEEVGEFKVSDAKTILNYINPNAEIPPVATLLTKIGCPFCMKAKKDLTDAGIKFEEIILANGLSSATLHNLSGRGTVPQVFINNEHIGGSDDLEKWLAAK